VTEGDSLSVLHRGSAVAELPVSVLVDDCPLYDLDPVPPSSDLYGAPAAVLRGDEPAGDVLLALLRSPNLASRRPLFEQYDPIVQSRTVRRPDEADAAVLMLGQRADSPAIAVSIDGNGRRVACDPRRGAAEAVYECAANLACVGAEPLGLTNCLNFGNPEKPHVAWQLVEAVEGLSEACEALGIPVVGGNVSLYNESPTGPIFPTPVVGMVGKLPHASAAGRLGFAAEGDAIALIGPFSPSSVGSELSKLRGEAPVGDLPDADARAIRVAQEAVRARVRSGSFRSAHDVAEGGVACSLAECCVAGGIGASVRLPRGLDAFAEAPGRAFIVSGPREALAGFVVIGEVGGDTLRVEGLFEIAVSELRAARDAGLSEWV
jgi:phosphoribosylformylglycinamidine synthase subunit PurL